MHAQLDLTHCQEALFSRQEGMLLIGVDHFARVGELATVWQVRAAAEREIDQVIILVDPHMQYGFQFHLVRRGVVGPHLFAHLHGADGLLPACRRHHRRRRKAQGAAATRFPIDIVFGSLTIINRFILKQGQELWGVYVFKRGFGGYPLRFLETHDLVYSPLVYGAYTRLLEIKRKRDERERRKIEERRGQKEKVGSSSV